MHVMREPLFEIRAGSAAVLGVALWTPNSQGPSYLEGKVLSAYLLTYINVLVLNLKFPGCQFIIKELPHCT